MSASPFPTERWFDPSPVIEHVNTATWMRGKTVMGGGRVGHLTRSKPGAAWVVEAVVRGSSGERYRTKVELVFDPLGQVVDWWSDCTCPMAENCKHGVAVTLKAAVLEPPRGAELAGADETDLERKRAEALVRLQDQEIGQWLGRIDGASLPSRGVAPPPTGAAAPELLRFALSLETSNELPLWNLRPVWMRRRAQGDGWLRPRPLTDYELPFLPYARRPEGLDEAAEDNLFQLATQLRSGADHRNPLFELRGRVGVELVRRLATQGVLMWLNPVHNAWQPLGWRDEARTLEWTWVRAAPNVKTDPQPHWRLALPEGGLRWGFNAPPLVADAGLNLIGPADTQGLSGLKVRALLTAPALSEPALKRHADRLLEALGPVTPPPGLDQAQRLVGLTPRAVLALTPVAEAQRAARGWVVARLGWDYEGHRVSQTAPAVLRVAQDADGQRRLLVRSAAQEATALTALPRLGLTAWDAEHWGLPGAEDQTPWLVWAAERFAAWQAEGLIVEADPKLTEGWVEAVDTVEAQWTVPEGEEGDASPWFDLSLGIEVEGRRVNALPWLPSLLAQVARMPVDPTSGERRWPPHVWLPRQPDDPMQGHWRLASAAIRPWLEALLELVGDRPQDFDAERLRVSRLDALRAHAALGEGVSWQPDPGLKALLDAMRGRQTLPEVPPPPGFLAELRPYQQQGLNWLQFLRAHGLAGVLADDMGLGKTVQTLAHVAAEKAAGRLDRPALIVAPVSLLGNWAREARRFSPELRTLVWHGQQRHGRWGELADHDLVIAPYSLLQRDRARWTKSRWHLVVLDEAQNIKNAATQAAQVACELDTRHRLCLSGTPMENHLGELWSLFHFLMPGFLGSAKRFGEWFRQPIEREGHAQRLTQLRARVTPFMLRRTKQQVVTELPPKQETVMRVELGPAQADLYESIRLSMESSVREALDRQGLARSQITILDALLKLRQVCCDPGLLKVEAARPAPSSAKLEQLMEMLPEMLQEGRRILLFSQFTTMLARIEKELARLGLKWVKLTGSSRDRDALVQRFTSGEVPLFLISLKAGGVGLNLPQADTVIHFDPWWNPAVENQATDRAHRIGQTQRVWVIKLVAQGTIEERMLALQARKAELAERVYEGAAARQAPMFTDEDVAELLRPMDMSL